MPRRIGMTATTKTPRTSPTFRTTLADRARAAAHAYDPYVRVVDVAVAGVASR
jgi:hypothetical protein